MSMNGFGRMQNGFPPRPINRFERNFGAVVIVLYVAVTIAVLAGILPI